jgi:hypothetical protein
MGTVSTRTSFTPRYTAARMVCGIVGSVTIGFALIFAALIFAALIGSQLILSAAILAALMLSAAIRSALIAVVWIGAVRIRASCPRPSFNPPGLTGSIGIFPSLAISWLAVDLAPGKRTFLGPHGIIARDSELRH